LVHSGLYGFALKTDAVLLKYTLNKNVAEIKIMKIWFEGDILPSYAPRMDKSITILGPGSASPDNPLKDIGAAQGIIASGFAYNAELMAQAPNALVITRLGIGYDRVDIPAATAAGIAVCNTPDGPTISTAECALTLIFSVARNMRLIDLEMRRVLQEGGKRNFYQHYRGIELAGKQLGLVGMGRIGSHVAKVARAMGMKIAAYDPYVTQEQAAAAGIQLMDSLEALLNMADVVSLHLPLNDETYKIMNAERFAQMKEGAIFVNTARGGHVDEAALLEVIDNGHLWGAGLDVTDPEPPLLGNPLLERENVIIWPHVASATFDGKLRIYELAMEQTMMALRGECPTYILNPEVWPRVREKWEAQQK
jgi:D-3-phosphoglycerate dehydrogenase